MQDLKFADLHVHTVYSDGTNTPIEIIDQAVNQKISSVAITDHDTVDAVPLAMAHAAENGIEVIPGIEFSARLNDKEVHLLGYFIDFEQEWFLRKLKQLRDERILRIDKILEKLKEYDINLEASEVLKGNSGSVGRLHIAKVMVSNGYTKTIWDVFDKYLGTGKPCFVPHENLTLKDAIIMVKELNGLSVLAHPYTLKNDNLLPEIVDLGIDGIEAYYPDHNSSQTKTYLNFAKKHKLLVTGGSDHHGLGKEYSVFGSFKIKYELVQEMKQALNHEK